MKKLSRRLEKRRRSLLEHYDQEDLHQLRITLRRMRGRLKGEGGKKLQHLRRDLGTLADATNAARDWDTLEDHARSLLNPRQYASLAPCLRRHREAAHTRVMELLVSDLWKNALSRWEKFALDSVRDADSHQSPKRARRRILAKLSRARARALEHESERYWHKLRIAIKELRYHLDEQPKAGRSQQVRQQISLCKQLQEELGNWHDTVIHRQLLADASGDAEAVLQLFERKLAREGEECLERIRAMLVDPAVEQVLSPGPR
jgi:CHAD domain-containing protein